MKPLHVWIGAAVLYALFFSWYTSFEGPLTEEEIAHYAERLSARADPEQLEAWIVFMRSDTGDDFAMLNALDLRDEPLAVPGVEPGESSADVMRRYTEPFLGRALRSAAHPIFVGDAAAPALDLWGIEGAESWDAGGLVRYRSRRDLMEQAMFSLETDVHAFKRAALEKTIAYPIDPFFHAGDPRLLLALLLLVIGLLLHLRIASRRAVSSAGGPAAG